MLDISGIRNIDPSSIGGQEGLVIANNPKVTICHLSNICTYLTFDPDIHPRTISNSGHCSSAQTVINACNNPPLCPLGDVNIDNQEELNRFLINYPTCTVINGSLLIGTENIIELSPLQNLTTINKA